MEYKKFHRAFAKKRYDAIVMVQKHLRSYFFWKKDILKNMRMEKLNQNDQFWEQMKVS